LALVASNLHPSFAVADSIRGLPVFGPLTRAIQCVYIKRDGDANVREMAIQSIMDRQTAIAHDGIDHAPICIFPEGTTTNGTHISPFKRGAFLSNLPVTPTYYRNRSFGPVRPVDDITDAWDICFIILCSMTISISTIHVMPVFTPNEYMAE